MDDLHARNKDKIERAVAAICEKPGGLLCNSACSKCFGLASKALLGAGALEVVPSQQEARIQRVRRHMGLSGVGVTRTDALLILEMIDDPSFAKGRT